MLMKSPQPTLSTLARSQHGYSLIELLVAMLSATVVAGALFAVLSFSTRETTTLADKVQADQLGRIAMTRIVDELHSSCLSPAFVPIQKESSETELRFVTAYSAAAVIPGAEEHRILWNKATSKLTDATYKSNGGEWPTFTFATSPEKTVVLATNVTQNEEASGTKVPIFRYYSYAEESTESETSPTSTLNTTPMTVPTAGLSSTEATSAASVLISFNANPTDIGHLSGAKEINRGLNLSSQVTFAFSVPNSETPIHDAPCE